MASSIIGQLRVILGIDTAAFDRGLSEAERNMVRAGARYQRIGDKISGIGKSLSIGLTLPLLAVGGASLKLASDFEASMNRVEAATGATGAQLKALRDSAKAFGADKSVTATAKDTADVMEALAKNGLSATQILNGATGAVLKLAAANAAEFAPAADLTTDVMQQFNKSAGDMDGVVDKLTGGMLVSKFGFDDYRLAMGQAGGVAGGLGLSFEETNTALASTAALFASGSDAGTSFKTFLTSLNPKSKEAATLMKKLGLDFFDASGRMKPLAAIAQLLQDKLAGLSDKAKSEALTTMFGTDAMRTAVGLMNQGASGLARINGEINKASAQEQMNARMKGLSGGLTQLKKAAEEAAIALGETGFLANVTALVGGITSLIHAFAGLPQPVQTALLVILGVGAAVGPIVAIVGNLVKGWGLLIVTAGRLSGILTGTAAAATGTAATMGALEGAMAFIAAAAWPIALAAIAAGLAYWAVTANEAGPATKAAQEALDEMNASHRAAEPAIKGTAEATHTATDEMESAIVKAQELATALYGVAAGAKAAALELAKQQLAASKAQLAEAQNTDDRSWLGVAMGVPKGKSRRDSARNRTAAGNVAIAQRTVDTAQDAYTTAVLDSRFPVGWGMKGPPKPVAPKTNPNLAPTGSTRHPREKKDRTEEFARKREELETEAKIEAYRSSGNMQAAQALQDRVDLLKQIGSYEQTGLSKAEARTAAERDMNLIRAARGKQMEQEIADERLSLDLDIAQLTDNRQLEESLSRQREIKQRVMFYQEHGKDLAEAEALALADQLRLDQARAAVRAQWVADDARAREISLAETRGDSEEKIRALKTQDDMIRRIRELQSNNPGMSNADASAQAMTEAMQQEQARQQGIWRDTVKGGFRAAMDGNFGSWFEGWWKDRVAKGMEDALNSLGDLIAKLFSNIGSGSSGGSGGGIMGMIAKVLGGAAGGSSDGAIGPVEFSTWEPEGPSAIDPSLKLPGFKTGGSFKVGGMSGIDRNVVSFRASAGEMVNITKGNDNGPVGSTHISAPLYLTGAVDLATKTEAQTYARMHANEVRVALTEAGRRRAGGR